MYQNLKMMKDLGIIGGWYKALDEQAEKIALAKAQVVYTGSMFFDLGKFLYSRRAVFRQDALYGHLVIKIGYDDYEDDGVFIYANSRGDRVHDKGLFTTKYGQGQMYTPIVIIDKENAPIIDQVTKDRQMKQNALERKIWNGERPSIPITEEEFSIVLSRLGVNRNH